MKDLDRKSLIIGFLAAGIIGVAAYASKGSGETGRYVPIMGGQGSMDTVTGKVYSFDGDTLGIRNGKYSEPPKRNRDTQSSDKVCEYCGQTVVNLGMHQISCEFNPNDATMNTKGTGKVRNND